MRCPRGADLKFRILGQLEVFDGRRWVSAGRPKCRIVLATLLIHAGETVSMDRLAHQLWDDAAPRTAANQVHGYVAKLRRTLADPDGRVIVTHSPGYQLLTRPQDIDANRFTSAVATGREALLAGDAQPRPRPPGSAKPSRCGAGRYSPMYHRP